MVFKHCVVLQNAEIKKRKIFNIVVDAEGDVFEILSEWALKQAKQLGKDWIPYKIDDMMWKDISGFILTTSN